MDRKEYQKKYREKNPEKKKQEYQRNKHKYLVRAKKYQEKNKIEIKQKMKERYKKKPEHYKELRIIYKYGMTYEDKEEMYKNQFNKCLTCQKDFSITNLHIDHDHETGKVRGLLCPQCNTALGLVKEDVITLKHMIEYLNDPRFLFGNKQK